MYPWVLVSTFSQLSVVLNIIHAQKELLAQFLAAIPPVALFLSFELLLAQLKETAVRLEAQNCLNHLIREIQIKESELDNIVREHSETIEKMEGEIGRLTDLTYFGVPKGLKTYTPVTNRFRAIHLHS